jgi:hypothetical protein
MFLALVGLAGVILSGSLGYWLKGALPMAGIVVLGYALWDSAWKRNLAREREEYRNRDRIAKAQKRTARQAFLDDAVSKGDLALALKALKFDMRLSYADEDDWRDRKAFEKTVVGELVKIATANGPEPLLAALSGGEWDGYKGPIITALGVLRESRAIPLLMSTRLRSSTEWTEVPKALLAMGNAVVEPMIEIMGNSSASEGCKGTAIYILGEVGDKRAVDLILPYLSSPYPNLCLGAATVLGKMRAKEAVPGLIEMLGRFEPHDSQRVVDALAKIGDKRAIEPIEQAMKKISPNYQGTGLFQKALDDLRAGNASA